MIVPHSAAGEARPCDPRDLLVSVMLRKGAAMGVMPVPRSLQEALRAYS